MLFRCTGLSPKPDDYAFRLVRVVGPNTHPRFAAWNRSLQKNRAEHSPDNQLEAVRPQHALEYKFHARVHAVRIVDNDFSLAIVFRPAPIAMQEPVDTTSEWLMESGTSPPAKSSTRTTEFGGAIRTDIIVPRVLRDH